MQNSARLCAAALFAALTAVCAQLCIPMPPVPVSMALFAVLLCGALLGAKWGMLSMGTYVLLGALGVPVFSGFSGGPSALLGPTGGFLAGYILCAGVTGRLCARSGSIYRRIAAMCAGLSCCYACGALWFMLTAGASLTGALSACVLPFLPGDALKILLAAHLSSRLSAPLKRLVS